MVGVKQKQGFCSNFRITNIFFVRSKIRSKKRGWKFQFVSKVIGLNFFLPFFVWNQVQNLYNLIQSSLVWKVGFVGCTDMDKNITQVCKKLEVPTLARHNSPMRRQVPALNWEYVYIFDCSQKLFGLIVCKIKKNYDAPKLAPQPVCWQTARCSNFGPPQLAYIWEDRFMPQMGSMYTCSKKLFGVNCVWNKNLMMLQSWLLSQL